MQSKKKNTLKKVLSLRMHRISVLLNHTDIWKLNNYTRSNQQSVHRHCIKSGVNEEQHRGFSFCATIVQARHFPIAITTLHEHHCLLKGRKKNPFSSGITQTEIIKLSHRADSHFPQQSASWICSASWSSLNRHWPWRIGATLWHADTSTCTPVLFELSHQSATD